MRTFVNAEEVTFFVREHMGGTITAEYRRGEGWDAIVKYGRKIVGQGNFPRIKNVEDWGRGLLRKARKS